MQDFINKLTSQVKNILSKTTTLQKAVLIGILVVGLGAIVATIVLTSRKTGTLLFQQALTQEDARNVIAVLDALILPSAMILTLPYILGKTGIYIAFPVSEFITLLFASTLFMLSRKFLLKR